MKPITRGITARWLRRPVMVVAALAAGLGFAAAPSQLAEADSSICPGANVAVFGPNVCVFNDTMSQAAIQNDLNSIATQQVPVASQFDSQRYAVLFQPGTYGSAANPLVFQVGYYTQVAGLGAMPQRLGRQRRHRRVQQPVHGRDHRLQLRTTTSGGRCPT